MPAIRHRGGWPPTTPFGEDHHPSRLMPVLGPNSLNQLERTRPTHHERQQMWMPSGARLAVAAFVRSAR